MPLFDATIRHIKDGLKGFTANAAIKNIEGWEATLEKVETTGVKTIVKDLENLKNAPVPAVLAMLTQPRGCALPLTATARGAL